MAIVVTAGYADADPVPSVRSVLGPVAVAGGATTGILAGSRVVQQGVLVVAFAFNGDVEYGAASVAESDIAKASGRAARLVLAGWPSRQLYPRGLTFAFASSGSPIPVLETWRKLMGAKMRAVCGVMPGDVTRRPSATPHAMTSVACLEAPYSTGLGYAGGFAPDTPPAPADLVCGALEATTTALKGLAGGTARLVVVLESRARHEALGASADREWATVRAEVGDRTPCVGWLCERVSGYGRGVRAVDEHGGLMVAAVGDEAAEAIQRSAAAA
jgi:hypothetical protein